MKKQAIVLFLMIINMATAETIYCQVITVQSGDTITCLTEKKQLLNVHLYQITAPKDKDSFAEQSKQALTHLILHKRVQMIIDGYDENKPLLATIFHSRPSSCENSPSVGSCQTVENINVTMLELGMARYQPLAHDNKYYRSIEEQAKSNKLGLWSNTNPVVP